MEEDYAHRAKMWNRRKKIRKTIHRRRRVRRASVFPSSSPHYCGTIYNFPRRLFIWRLQPKEFWKRKEDTNSYCSFSFFYPPHQRKKTILSLFSFFIVMGEWSLAFFTSLLLDPNGRTNRAPVKRLGCPHQLTHVALSSDDTFSLHCCWTLSLKAIGLERCSFF